MKYDICLSFASEDRGYVEQVARQLRDRQVRIFYDDYSQTDLWGKDLYAHLNQIYKSEARFCVIFASVNYAAKIWTNHELRGAQERALRSTQEYILPVRFDDTEIPGLSSNIGYIDLAITDPSALTEMICAKLEIEEFDSGANPTIFWQNPARMSVAGPAMVHTFQDQAIDVDADGLENVIRNLIQSLLRRSRTADGVRFWTQGADRNFDRYYVTASVVTALRQSGLSSRHYAVSSSDQYLKTANPRSLDDRAATIYLMSTGQLSTTDCLDFVRLLRVHQLKDMASPYQGSFLLPQGPSIPANEARGNWSATPLHADGASFHACHLADALLHASDDDPDIIDEATAIVHDIRAYLIRSTKANGGWLTSLAGERTPLTLYAYALMPLLSIPLPKEWRSNTDAALKLLQSGRFAPITVYFGLMNVAYMYSSTQDQALHDLAGPFITEQLHRLAEPAKIASLDVLELAALLRGIAYAVPLIMPSVPSVVREIANRVAPADPEDED